MIDLSGTSFCVQDINNAIKIKKDGLFANKTFLITGKLKDISRTNTKMDKEILNKFIEELNIDNAKKQELYNITIENYIGRV